MKKILMFLFGDLGVFVSATIMTIASWFLMPLFVDIVSGVNKFSNLLGYVLICPFAFGFFLSSLISGVTLIVKGIKSKNYVLFGLGTLVVIFDVVILVLSLV